MGEAFLLGGMERGGRSACAARVLAAACLAALVFALLGAGGKAHAAVPELEYGGDELAFISQDGEQFGMYSAKDGSSVEYKDGKIAVEHVTSNKTIYAGFYLEADKDDPSTWDAAKFYPCNSGGWLTFELDPSYAGKMWPVAPVKKSDMTATTSGQYYLAVPKLEKIPGYLLTVTFTDGMGGELYSGTVVSGEDATPPEVPQREGFTFYKWDRPYTNITEDVTINAVWLEEGVTYYTVTFADGWGNVIDEQRVKEGEAAQAPADPVCEGYTFTGWEPASFDNVTADLTVEAQWQNDVETALEAARAAIAALPEDPTTILGDLENDAVSQAVAAYNALSDDQKAQLTDDERLLLAKCAIAVLPSDPYDVTADLESAITVAGALYGALSQEQRDALDTETVSSGRTYGRYLENSEWALDALNPVNDATTLKDGTYTGQVESVSSMGKSTSRRALPFTVKSITVKDGKATAIIEHGSNSSQSLRIGGQEYQNLQTDGSKNSYFEVPIELNSTFHFAIKGKNATDATDAITYEMTTVADEATMTPDAPSEDGGSEGDAGDGSGDDDGAGSDDSSGDDGKDDAGDDSSDNESDDESGDDTSTESSGSSSTSSSSGTTLTAATSNPGSVPQGGTSTTARTGSVVASPAAAKNSTASASSKSSGASSSKPGKDAGGDATVSEIGFDVPDVGPITLNVSLAPAIAGGALLSIALGVLVFVLRFVRRESAFV